MSLKDLETLTEVSKDTIKRLREKYGDDFAIKFDSAAQPDFTKYMEGFVRIPNPSASNYADLAWAQLKKDKPDLYNKLYPQKHLYNWHHAPDGSLQLIDKDLHTAFQHTGPQSIMKAAASFGIVLLIPGYESFKEGDKNAGCRDTIWGYLPLTWISDFSYAVFAVPWDWGQAELNSPESKARQERYRERFSLPR